MSSTLKQGPQEKAALINSLCDEVIRLYASLGLKIAEDKTLTSTHLFHFLNRMYAEGSKIVMPFRTITKISPNLICLINTFAGQIEELGSSSQGAAVGKICSDTAAHTAIEMLAKTKTRIWRLICSPF
jgi:hypothetical protein